MALLALWNPNIQFLKTDGTINAGGKLVVTDHNDAESIPANYSDADGTTLNPSPIVLDALGRATCYIDDASTYDLYVKDANGATLWTVPEMTPGAETIVVRAGFSVSSNDSSVAVVISVDPNGVTSYDLSIQDEIDRAEGAEGALAEDIADEIDRAKTAEKAAKTVIVAGNNITVTKTVGADGQDVYTVSGEAGDNLVEDVRVNGASVVTDKVANIDVPVAGTASPLMDGTASAGASGKYAREDHAHPSDTSREAVANKTTVVQGSSDSKYPTDKAVWNFVNSSIATNTAYYISDNGEPFTSVEELEAYPGIVTNNDYAFVTGTDSAGNTYYDRYKATVRDSTVTWALEYRLNNSSFTAAQWAAINSGITSALVGKIHEHANKTVLDGITATDVSNWNNKLDKNGDGSDVTVGFTEAENRTNIATGSKLSTLFGQIRKWFADLGALAFKDTVDTSDVESGTYSIDISGNAATATAAASGSTLETAINAKANGDKSVAIFDGYMRRMSESPGWRRLAYKQFNFTNTNLNALFRLYLFGSNNEHIGLGNLVVNIRFNSSGSAPYFMTCSLMSHKPLNTLVKVKVIGVAGNAVVELWFKPLTFSLLTITCLGNGLDVTPTTKDWMFGSYFDATDPEPVEDIANNVYVFSGTDSRIQTSIANPTNGNLVAMDADGLVKDSGKAASDFAASSHTHSVKINGTMKTIPATGGTVVDLGTYLTSHQAVSDNNPTLAWGTTSTVGTVGNTELRVTMPSNPASGKADKVSGATAGDVATLDANGNLVDSGKTLGTSVPADAAFTDDKVAQMKADSSTTAYPLLMAGTTDPRGNATVTRYDSSVTLDPSTNTIAANISGNAATADSATTASSADIAGSTSSGTILGNSDLNSYNVANRNYLCNATNASTVSNKPTGASGAFELEVIRGTGATCVQVYYSRDDVNFNYIRKRTGNDAWTGWVKMYRDEWVSFTPDTLQTTEAAKIFAIGNIEVGYYFDSGSNFRLSMRSTSGTRYVYLADQHGNGGGYALTTGWTGIMIYGFTNSNQLESLKGYDTTGNVNLEFDVYYANGASPFVPVAQYRVNT